MKELFHPERPSRIASATASNLARLCHHAEDTGDDVLLLQITAEVERREQLIPDYHSNHFMPFYRLAWANRKTP